MGKKKVLLLDGVGETMANAFFSSTMQYYYTEQARKKSLITKKIEYVWKGFYVASFEDSAGYISIQKNEEGWYLDASFPDGNVHQWTFTTLKEARSVANGIITEGVFYIDDAAYDQEQTELQNPSQDAI